MEDTNDGENPLPIPNLQDLCDTLEADSDSQKLLEIFRGASSQIPTNLASITDLWLKEASEENAAWVDRN